MLALIDGDILLYGVGFSVESKRYELVDAAGNTVASYRYSKEVWDRVSGMSQEVLDTLDLRVETDVEPVSHAYQNMKEAINSIVTESGADEYRVYLSGDNNYRESVATIAKYKGNRDQLHKPVYFPELREFLLTYHNAEIVEGQEADDAMGIAQCTMRDTIICTKDKDLKMIPGRHYNMNTREVYEISEDEAIRFFYTQLLTGDPTDNIKGIPGCGPKTAKKILAGCKTEKEMYQACLNEYNKAYPDPLSAVIETGQLLWIRRAPGEMWSPPGSVAC